MPRQTEIENVSYIMPHQPTMKFFIHESNVFICDNFVFHLACKDENFFNVIADTGTSLNITPCEDDIIQIEAERPLGNIQAADGKMMPMTKFGYAEYFVRTTKKQWVPFYPLMFYVKGSACRLISPQAIAKQYRPTHQKETYGGNDQWFWMEIGNNHHIQTNIDQVNNMPAFSMRKRLPSDPPRKFVLPPITLHKIDNS